MVNLRLHSKETYLFSIYLIVEERIVLARPTRVNIIYLYAELIIKNAYLQNLGSNAKI